MVGSMTTTNTVPVWSVRAHAVEVAGGIENGEGRDRVADVEDADNGINVHDLFADGDRIIRQSEIGHEGDFVRMVRGRGLGEQRQARSEHEQHEQAASSLQQWAPQSSEGDYMRAFLAARVVVPAGGGIKSPQHGRGAHHLSR